jgi:hypothetical protein
MGTASHPGTQGAPEIAASHLDDAREAEVMMSFRVWPDALADGTAFRDTPSFSAAFQWLREGPHASMQVPFRWRAGDREGDGYVTYVAAWHPTATERFVESSIRNMISVAIADALAAGRFIRLDPEDVDEARAAQLAFRRERAILEF